MNDRLRTELLFTRRFSMSHRLISGYSERCAIPHGHNEYVTVTLGAGPNNPHASQLDGHVNMLLPFAEAKGRWFHFIDERMDHSFQISEHDPLLTWFRNNEPQRLERLVVTPGDPTTELLAALLLAKLNAFLTMQGKKLCALSLELRETPTNSVKLHGNPTTYLPSVSRPVEACWWNRADDSMADL